MSGRARILVPLFAVVLLVAHISWGDDNHFHDEGAKSPEKTSDLEHEDHGEDGGHEEESSAVGPEKGVTQFHPEKGLRLSPEAQKNFGIVITQVTSTTSGIEIPRAAILESQSEKYVYVEASGLLRRVPISIVRKTADAIVLKPGSLSLTDKIVTSGVSFIRAAELDVTSGSGSHGH